MTECEQCKLLREVIAAKDALIQSLMERAYPLLPVPPSPQFPGNTWMRDQLGGYDRTRDCPCRIENGGSGICGCVHTGQITC